MIEIEFKLKFIDKELNLVDIDAYSLRGESFYASILNDNQQRLESNRKFIKKNDQFVCFLCGHIDGVIKLKWSENYTLIQCRKCEAISANITPDCSQEIYKDVDNFKLYAERISKYFNYRKKTFGQERYYYTIERLKLNNNKIKLLDVGCGVGYFLDLLKDKEIWARGLEVDPLQVKYCKDMGLNVSSNNISDEPDGYYDVVTMFDVLEHLIEPVDFFLDINKVLKPNGYIVMYTPNIHSIGFELMAEKQNLLHPFEHVCFYNKSSLDFLVLQTNFKIVSIEFFGLDIMDYLLYKEHQDNCKYTQSLQSMMTIIQSCLDKLEVSNHMRITLQKN